MALKTLNTSRFGQYMFTKGTNVNLRAEPGISSKVITNVATSGTEIGNSSGVYAYDEDKCEEWYQFIGSKYGTGWIRADLVTFSKNPGTVSPATPDTPSTPSSTPAGSSSTSVMPSTNSSSNILMYALIAAAGLFLVPKIIDLIKNQKSKIKNVRK